MANVRTGKGKVAQSNGNSGFIRAGIVGKRRLIIAAGSLAKSGKTNFGLTMPGPLAVINLDEGLDGVIQKFQDTKEIWAADHRAAITSIKAGLAEGESVKGEADKEWESVKADYVEAVNEARSVFVDTGTEFYELLRLARFGKLDKVMPHHYTQVNREMKSLIDLAYASNANVVFSHRLKREYVNDKSTDNLLMAGWSDMSYECQAVLRQYKDPAEDYPGRFHIAITDCRLMPQIEGEDLAGELATFPMIAQLVFPESKESDWL